MALAAIKGEKTLAELGAAIRCPSQPDHAVEGAAPRRGGRGVRGEARRTRCAAVDLKALHAKIGELTLENDFLEGALSKAGLLSAKR